MRPIYLYYKNLKAALDAKGKQGQLSHQTQNSNQAHINNIVANDKQQVVVTNNYLNVKGSGIGFNLLIRIISQALIG